MGVILVILTLVASGCGDGDPRGLDWTIAFSNPEDRATARLVVASIRRGGCSTTEVVWSETIRPDAVMGLAPPALEPGTWGFSGRARDDQCRWHAEGCIEATLGDDAQPPSVRTLMQSVPPDPECPPSECDDGECGGADGGVRDAGMRDAGTRDAGMRDSGPDAPIACTPADDECTDGTLRICDMTTGTLGTTVCPAGCAPAGELRCARVVPSNVEASLLDPSLPDVAMTAGGTIDTDTCDPGFGDTMIIDRPMLAELCVIRTGALELGGTWTVTGRNGLVFLAGGAFTLSGTIDAAARGQTRGPGGSSGGSSAGADGFGRSEGAGGSLVGADSSGGGGGGLCGAGGDGGDEDTVPGGAGGPAVTGWDLIPLHGGSGGGAGVTGTVTALGGGGGGAVQVTSAVSITITGAIHVGGGGGGGGDTGGSTTPAGSGGGGGSGGAVLLEAPIVMLDAAAVIAASGGGGGGSPSSTMAGGAGADALGSLTSPAGGVAGGTGGEPGGAGAAGATLDGADAANTANLSGPGGGGGVGCLLFRSVSAMPPSGLVGLSPSVAPAMRAMALVVE